MNFPENLKYTKDHEWIKETGNGEALVGITEFAQGELGDIVFVEVETIGETLKKEEVFGTIEAVKTVSDMFMPVSGEVLELNSEIESNPEIINKHPYNGGWIVKIKMTNPAELNELMNAADYSKHASH